MKEADKKNLTKFIVSLMGFLKVVLGVFLTLVVLIIISYVFEIEQLTSLFSGLTEFLQDLSVVFYRPRFSEEESAPGLVFLALALICLLFFFEAIADSIEDILKFFEKTKEEAIAIDNKNVNKQIQKNYEQHLKNAVQFVLVLRLIFEKANNKIDAFQDAELEKENQEINKRLMAELRTSIVKNVKCKFSVTQDSIIMQIPSAEVLNRILFFIRSMCQVPKYTSRGLVFYIAVTTFTAENPIETALNEANKIIGLQIKNRIVCYQIVDECLKFVPTNNFKAINIGDYYDVSDSLFELVNKY